MNGSKHRDEVALRCDFEALRAVISAAQIEQLEQIRLEHLPDERWREFFWRLARHEMIQRAKPLPDSAQKIAAAKVGALGAMLGLSSGQIATLVQKVDVAAFIAAAQANVSIQEFQNDPRYRELWTETNIRRNPPFRCEFEHATVFGSISEAGDIAKNKSWGLLIDLQPLRSNDRLFPMHISYSLKPTSRLRMRWEFRDTFRNVLGSRHRRIVANTLRDTKRLFLERLNAEDAKVIRDRLDLTPEKFWQMCRYGEKFGPDGIFRFMTALEEKTKGYCLPFPKTKGDLVQIQPVS